ncbi:hypothetical protein CR5_009 [Cronobacter phage CR5]|uniref:Uncharacterized protein n=1 Tax=Salmonella muenchen TaxID=596 RepID=A0A5U8XPC4_SALMU|nr:hypothetical protein CR5_009 [Cronobacter phage CR5]EBS0563173.1 hypothetical protein [Salmonella enterica subsp. enterica serovar Muenchen]EBZ2963176.1 hypothetical protein [Salmonella enterica subsp. enterica serovar Enteritidis]ECG1798490.1 hypothetical protein [Salmonella enterica subsp. enterica serovar Paratyphi B]AFO71229.1 hypothetical protein CR5_009 [Cronobacter phage CR5]ECQ9027105.1 hypothetical protein [Salmonella enterica subsp. enterica serovar Enteritidis]
MSEIILVIPPVDLSALGRVYQVNRLSFVELARAIENLIYPGRHLDISDAYNTFAEAFFATDLWFTISTLGQEKPLYFKEINGALVACTTLNSTQLTFMVGFGMRSKRQAMQTRYA